MMSELMTRERSGRLSRRAVVLGAGAAALAGRGRSAAAQCELVEVYPGYPGYAGFITGLDWLGDVRCLDDLEAENPRFDRAFEDSQNLLAAQRLGINGSPVLWTWENWLAIEAEQGMVPTCYVCGIGESRPRITEQTSPRAGDPRLLIGGFGTTYALTDLAEQYDTPMWLMNMSVTDDSQLRAMVGVAWPGYLNAEDVLSGYHWVMTDVFGRQDGAYLDVSALWKMLIAQGGYAPVPDSAHPNDQIFLMVVGVSGITPFMSSEAAAGIKRQLDRSIDNYIVAVTKGSRFTFIDYLRENGAANWL